MGEELFMISHWFVTSDSNSSHTLTLSRFKFTQCKHIGVTTICSCDVIHQLPIGYLSSALGRAFKLVVHTSGTKKSDRCFVCQAHHVPGQSRRNPTCASTSLVHSRASERPMSIIDVLSAARSLGSNPSVCPTYHSCFGD